MTSVSRVDSSSIGRVVRLGVLGAVALWATGALVACGSSSTDQAEAAVNRSVPSARAVRVEVVELEPASATLELDLPGEVTGDRDALLAAANGGFVESVLVEDGDTVKQGQSLVRVDTALYAAQLEQADAQRDQAQVDVERLEKLGDLGSDAQIAMARTQLRVAEANRSLAATRLSRAVVKAPFDGVVVGVTVERGEAVPPGGAASPAAQSTERQGVVKRISPAADVRTRAFPVEIEVPNPDGTLLPGMIARVFARRPIAAEAMVVPQDWIVTLGDRRGVFLTKGDLAEWRDVELGDVIHDKVVVTKGLATGDRVVITGHRDLVDGDPLIISREGRCCSAGRPTYGE